MLRGILQVIAERRRDRWKKMAVWAAMIALPVGCVLLEDSSRIDRSYYESADAAADAPAEAAEDENVELPADEAIVVAPSDPAHEVAAAASEAAAAAADAAARAGAASAALEGPSTFIGASIDSGGESRPAAYASGQVLNRMELRYCRRQKVRLSSVQNDPVDNEQIARWNEAADDYNARCGRFRYDERDMAAIEAEIATRSFLLRNEGLDILNGVR